MDSTPMTERLLQMLDRLMESKPCDRTFVVEVRPVKGNPLIVLTYATSVLSQALESINRSNISNKRSVKVFGIH
jgi:hypothetical protein